MKNLENEYKQDIENSVPDLWDRIDKGLDEIEGHERKYEEPVTEIKWYRKASKKITKIGGFAVAACVLLFLIFYVFPGMSLKKEASENASNSAAFEATYERKSETKAEISKADGLSLATPMPMPTSGPDSIQESVMSEDIALDEQDTLLLIDLEDRVIELDDGTYMLEEQTYRTVLLYNGQLPDDGSRYAGGQATLVILSNTEDLSFDGLVNAMVPDDEPYFQLDPETAAVVRFEIEMP